MTKRYGPWNSISHTRQSKVDAHYPKPIYKPQQESQNSKSRRQQRIAYQIKSEKERKQMASSYRTQSAKRWLPLEANPDVMNQVLKSLNPSQSPIVFSLCYLCFLIKIETFVYPNRIAWVLFEFWCGFWEFWLFLNMDEGLRRLIFWWD